MSDTSDVLREAVEQAFAQDTPLAIRGSGSKDFYCSPATSEPLETRDHHGVIDYEPTELVVTARAGTPLREIESLLAGQQQMLAFEPPHFGPEATLGGAVACGFSGPRRPYAGSLRDAMLGCRLINGKAEIVHFGGQVMKNVAGYDLSRLMVGAMGTLGVLLDVSLRVLPKPAVEMTTGFELPMGKAQEEMNRLAGTPMPLSAMAFSEGVLYVRLAGAEKSVQNALLELGGETLSADHSCQFWYDLREQKQAFFGAEGNLWRLSVAASSPVMEEAGQWLLDWGGAQRWLISDAAPDDIFALAASCGGHATLWRTRASAGSRHQPLSPAATAMQQRIRQAFDPKGILNPGCMAAEL